MQSRHDWPKTRDKQEEIKICSSKIDVRFNHLQELVTKQP